MTFARWPPRSTIIVPAGEPRELAAAPLLRRLVRHRVHLRPRQAQRSLRQSTFAMTASPAEAEKLFRHRWGLGPWSRTLAGGPGRRAGRAQRHLPLGQPVAAGPDHFGRQPVGNLFVARRGAAVFSLLVTGACFDSAEAFSSLVLPTLTKAEGGRRKGEGRTKDKGSARAGGVSHRIT